jgi:hypothetical protein
MYRKRKKTPARSPASFEVPVYLATIAASHDRVMRQPINPITAKESVFCYIIICRNFGTHGTT